MKPLQQGHVALYQRCRTVLRYHPILTTIFKMKETMSQYGGVGLAANQIGVMDRIICIKVGGFKEVIINPVIVKRYGGKHTAKEGCLSFPGKQALMVRDKQIIVEGFNADWEPVRFKLKNICARVVQHEVDHLNGVTIL